MKFRVRFKDSNVCMPVILGAEKNVWDKYVEYDEYVEIEFDSRTGKARVVPVTKR